jgi:hypothetical protein
LCIIQFVCSKFRRIPTHYVETMAKLEKSITCTPKFLTQNPSPQTINLEPYIQNPKSLAAFPNTEPQTLNPNIPLAELSTLKQMTTFRQATTFRPTTAIMVQKLLVSPNPKHSTPNTTPRIPNEMATFRHTRDESLLNLCRRTVS